MRKILFVTSTFPSSDTDPVPAFVKDEAIWLNKIYGYDISVLAPHNAYSRTKSFQNHNHYKEYRFHYFFPFKLELLAGRGIEPALRKNKLLYIQLPFFFVFEFIALFRLAYRIRPQIIYAHWFTPQAIMSLTVSKLLKIPFVFDTQASDVIVLKKIPLAKKIVATVCTNALAYTAPSKMTVDKLEYFTTEQNREKIMNKLTIVPMGTKLPKRNTEEIEKIKLKYNLTNKKTILFMGRLVDRKGVDTLLEAFSRLTDIFKDYELLVAGDGQEAEKLRILSEKLNIKEKVHFLGYVTGSKKTSLLYLADLYALPSINVGDQAEGLPIAFMEAVTAGKITIVSDATGAHELITPNKNAFLFEAGNINDLTDKLRLAMSLSEKERNIFTKKVLAFSKKFQWEKIITERHNALKLDY